MGQHPLAQLVADRFADNVFESALASGGSWIGTFGWLVGTGPGAGMALILILCGLLATLVSFAGYLSPIVRNAEELLPDHEAIQVAVDPPLSSDAA